MNALIVEEDVLIRELLVESIEEITEYRCIKADSKEMAFNLLESFEFQLVLIDFWTSNLILDDILERIKECGDPKVIVLTTMLNKENLEKVYKIKVINKPFDIDKFFHYISKNDIDSY